ncbi:DNA mismatch repair protein MutH [Alteribacillus persepolensis]|uniref:DNA mismatch repair protein MutH n=1 Tax=Alteribacillus persepolensis TaxID=568899 RepID=A0A1G8JEL2_9BACI|nr:Sau3AI family type II restriction endonuclease [Alteribacillus persepolensis]SDI29709.1 DNA mismatch repair protein MutH [Alteribacillus persepolensis]
MSRYDIHNPISIEEHGKRMEGKTFRELSESNESYIAEEKRAYEIIKNNKGNLGQLVEEIHFGYKPNSNAAPDFEEAGVELKVTPYYKLKRKGYSAKERLVLNIINYETIISETFKTSSFWKKNSLILLVHYLYQKDKDKLDFLITNVQLFEFPDSDFKIIQDDWHTIKEKVKEGKAHELSERDTNYLSACTKGATSKTSMRTQPNSPEKAKQRAFSLKASYMTYILNNYILPKNPTYTKRDSILDKNTDKTLDQYILDTFERYYSLKESQLIQLLDIDASNKPKNLKALIAARIFNSNLNDLKQAEEIEKANIKVKTMRLEKNGKIKESMSFPHFSYLDIINQTWENSDLRNMFLETKFLFIIFQKDGQEFKLEKAMFWKLPEHDLENDVRKVWEATVHRIRNGRASDLPSKSDNKFNVAHVRPHGQNKYDTLPTPDGGEEVKKCFWLNNDYILGQISE